MRHMARRSGKKEETLLALWEWVKTHAPETLEFSNAEVKDLSGLSEFSNQFDVTHIDTQRKLPDLFRAEDIFLVNLGYRPGRHRFVHGLEYAFCKLPPPEESSDPSPWKYPPGYLDDIDDSEAGVLSLAFNKSIFADFLFRNPYRRDLEVHLPRRTRVSFRYGIGPTTLTVENLQVEVDFLVQGQDVVGLAEAKFVDSFDKMPDFNVLQLYLPYRRLAELMRDEGAALRVRPLFALGYRVPGTGMGIRLYEFSFEREDNAWPIKLLRSCDYLLEKRVSGPNPTTLSIPFHNLPPQAK